MESSNESEIRLAELIWRTVKLRVTLLIFAIVALLIVWSSLSNGNEEAQKIDTQFCGYLVDQHNALQKKLSEEVNKAFESQPGFTKSQPLLLTSEEQCHQLHSRTWIEIIRSTDEELNPEPLTVSPELEKDFTERSQAFSDYDARRRAAYRLQIQLGSESEYFSTIIVNALTVASIMPFCVFVVLTIVMLLGFQQSAYQRQLRSLLQVASDRPLPQALAETQFFAVPMKRESPHIENYLTLSPSGLAIGSLTFALVLLLVQVVSTFILNLVHLTDSIILSYPFALYASLAVLSWLLIITHKLYGDKTSKDASHDEGAVTEPLSRVGKGLTIFFAAGAFLSLALPWAKEASADEGWFFRGFEFLLNQRPVSNYFASPIYGLSPQIFRDVRIQVTIAVAFLVICACQSLLSLNRTRRLGVSLYETRRVLAVCLLALSIYYLAYMVFLEYESVFWVPWLDKILWYKGPGNARGYSMMYYDPAYGFWIFLGCALVLVRLSLANEARWPNTWVIQLGHLVVPKWKALSTALRKSLLAYYKHKKVSNRKL